MHGLVGKDRHFSFCPIRLNLPQGFRYALIHDSVVELMFPIVGKEILQGLFEELLVVRIAERSANEHWCAISHIGSHNLAGQFRMLEVAEHGIDRVDQVETRIYQSSIQVKDHQLHRARIKLAMELGHKKRIALGIQALPRSNGGFRLQVLGSYIWDSSEPSRLAVRNDNNLLQVNKVSLDSEPTKPET